jgi:iron complex transport system substrate-binding protein
MGAGNRIIGVSRFDDLPEVARLPRVGGFIDPSVEAVLSLKPQLVLLQPSPGNRQPVEKLAELGVPVLALPMHSIAEVIESIREVGKVLGLADPAERLVQDLERARRSVRARSRAKKPPRVLFIYGFEPLVVAGPGSFADELLKDAGAINAAEGAVSAYPVYSAEKAVRSNPDVVINAAADESAARKFSHLAGLKQARWVKLPSQDLLHPGPRLGRGLEEMFALLYPEPAPAAR